MCLSHNICDQTANILTQHYHKTKFYDQKYEGYFLSKRDLNFSISSCFLGASIGATVFDSLCGSFSVIIFTVSDPVHIFLNISFFYYTPTTKGGGGAILDSLCRVGRSVGRSVRLQFLSAL